MGRRRLLGARRLQHGNCGVVRARGRLPRHLDGPGGLSAFLPVPPSSRRTSLRGACAARPPTRPRGLFRRLRRIPRHNGPLLLAAVIGAAQLRHGRPRRRRARNRRPLASLRRWHPRRPAAIRAPHRRRRVLLLVRLRPGRLLPRRERHPPPPSGAALAGKPREIRRAGRRRVRHLPRHVHRPGGPPLVGRQGAGLSQGPPLRTQVQPSG